MGEGVFGCVFTGILPDGCPVAVKKLKIGNGQGECAFKAEVDTISRITSQAFGFASRLLHCRWPANACL
jgi:hypothetical protein